MNSKDYFELVDKLEKEEFLSDEEMKRLISCNDEDVLSYLYKRADEVRRIYYGNKIYVRGLIEISNICKNDCIYCGIRCSNKLVERYRMPEESIMSCVESGYANGFRTFVLQGGEDAHFTDEVLCNLLKKMKAAHPDCAITLSVGERSYDSYKALYEAGAERYLLRHETANEEHYKKLHPSKMSWQNRMECLKNLKKIGFQTGTGMMVESPYQTLDDLVTDLKFLRDFKPEMVGIGPFIPHKDTPFADKKAGSLFMTIKLISIIRLIHPKALIPATTALGTIDPKGREKGILAGANVVMPNLSPDDVKHKYSLYDNKLATGVESVNGLSLLKEKMSAIGYEVVVDRGDFVG